MNLPFFIARRYLFAKKSHNVINIISAISSIGMAVGTAALIVILSVYNGFDAIVKTTVSSVEPDLMIVPSEGKFFVPDGPAYDFLYESKAVASMCTVLEDNVFVSYNDKQLAVRLKGVDDIYIEESPLRDHISDGEFRLRLGEINYAAMGRGLARRLGADVAFQTPLTLYYPERGARISVANPMSSINSVKAWPSCEFAVNADIDQTLMIVDRRTMCELTGCTDEVSSVEVRFAPSAGKRDRKAVEKRLRSILGEDFKVLDRIQQNPETYKMLKYEKLSVYLIMIFIALILGFSIFGSLSMLIIDKSEDIATLKAMGAESVAIRRIFTLEGWFITLLGMLAGLVVGIVLCVIQQRFSLVKMPGNFLVDAYPVVLNPMDVLYCVLSISLIGYIIALIPSLEAIRKSDRYE